MCWGGHATSPCKEIHHESIKIGNESDAKAECRLIKQKWQSRVIEIEGSSFKYICYVWK
jgi:hypothetical protein